MMTETGLQVPDYRGVISSDFKAKAEKAYSEYKSQKEQLKNNIIENYKWYEAQHGSKFSADKNKPSSTTEYVFSAIENKYADALDNYPEASVLERSADDAETVKVLSKILPVQLELSKFKKAYKKNWRRKMKTGTGIYFIDCDRENEEITINSVNVLAFFADFNVDDIQDSEFVFVTRTESNENLKAEYPEFSALFEGDCTLETADGPKNMIGRTEVVDCYYKKYIKDAGGKTKQAVHLMKWARGCILEATEDIPGYEDGMYLHGKYPFVLDVMYPKDESPFGFGIVDIVKDIQNYIDKMDNAISRNTIIASKVRYVIKDHSGINADELADFSKDIIHASGDVQEGIRELQCAGLPGYITQYRDRKIEELKEIIGNRDFQQGGNAGGVVSGSAIELLQQSGAKMSRASIDDSYDAYKEICIMVIELMRECFTEEKVYRITGDGGENEFVTFSGENLYKKNALGFADNSEPIEFDVSITPQRSNPYSKQGTNATMVQLWEAGVFNPQNMDASILLIKNMQFEGKDKLLSDFQTKQQEIVQQQQAMQQQAKQQQAMQQQATQQMPSEDELIPIQIN